MGQVDKAKSSKKAELPTRSSGSVWKSGSAQFVQYELDKLGQAECKAWQLQEDACLDYVLKLCEQGYKFVLKQDLQNNCYACFMSTDLPQHEHANMVLAGRGSSPFKALKQTLFKHFTCLNEIWLEHVGRKGSDEIDD